MFASITIISLLLQEGDEHDPDHHLHLRFLLCLHIPRRHRGAARPQCCQVPEGKSVKFKDES